MGKAAAFAAALACAAALSPPSPAGAAEDGASCDAASLDSVPGRQWSAGYGWRYDTSTAADPAIRASENAAARARAYADLVSGQSPWPDWFTPSISPLQPGTLFQMAMSSDQPDDRPGGFGTFDDITGVEAVRLYLAVLPEWKPDVQRINTYRVKEVLLVLAGPIGPQVDAQGCTLLPGRFSQFQMLVAAPDRMRYIELVSSRPLP